MKERWFVAYCVLAALFAMNLLNYVDRFILASVVDQIQKDPAFYLNDTQAGFLSTAFFVSYVAFSPITGWLGDRWPRKYLLAAGVGYGQMLLSRCLLGVGEASYATLAPTLIGDLFRRDRRNLALTIFYIAIPVGAALGYLLGGVVSSAHGWRMAFYVVGLPGLLLALIALLIPEPRRGASEDVDDAALDRHDALPLSWPVYAALARNRSFLFNCLAMAMFTFALGGLQYWAPKFFVFEKGITVPDDKAWANLTETERADARLRAANERVGLWLGAVVGLGGLLGTAVGGLLCHRLTKRWGSAYFWVSGGSMLASVPFIVIVLLGQGEAFIFGSLFVGLTLASMNYGPSNTIIVNVTDPKIRAAAFAINIFLIHILGDIPSPTLMGAVSDLTGNLFWGMSITIPAMAASGIFFCLGSPHLERDQEAVLKGLRACDLKE
jgi:MFS family permease